MNIVCNYGMLSYVILLLYCTLRSGSVPLFAGLAAYFSALNLGWVAVVVFTGGYLGHELHFYLGRKYAIARLLLDRYGKAYIHLSLSKGPENYRLACRYID